MPGGRWLNQHPAIGTEGMELEEAEGSRSPELGGLWDGQQPPGIQGAMDDPAVPAGEGGHSYGCEHWGKAG